MGDALLPRACALGYRWVAPTELINQDPKCRHVPNSSFLFEPGVATGLVLKTCAYGDGDRVPFCLLPSSFSLLPSNLEKHREVIAGAADIQRPPDVRMARRHGDGIGSNTPKKGGGGKGLRWLIEGDPLGGEAPGRR